jgi:hypothetical protein
MANMGASGAMRQGNVWRLIGWGGAVMLLLTPLVAMRFTNEVRWDETDFIVMGGLMLAVGIPLELVVRANRNWSYRLGAGLALLTSFLIVWANLAVGIIGSENNPANSLYFLVILLGVAAAAIERFRPAGMARAMVVTSVAHMGATAVAALLIGSDEILAGPALRAPEIVGNTLFAGLFLGSAWLFRAAAAQSSSSS